MVTATRTAVTTVYRNGAPNGRLPSPGVYALILVAAALSKIIWGMPVTSEVTFTASALAPGGMSVATAVVIVTGGRTSTAVETVPPPGFTPVSDDDADSTTSSFISGSTDDANTGGVQPRNQDDESSKLSTLETAGIVLGIVVGLITMIATVYMCAKGHRVLQLAAR